MAKATGLQNAGTCVTSLLALVLGPDKDPGVRLKREVFVERFALWVAYPAWHERIRRHWAKLLPNTLGSS